MIGYSGRFPMARGLEEFWENLRDGRDCISEVPVARWDWRRSDGLAGTRWGGFLNHIDKFEPRMFGIAPRQAAAMDPQRRIFLEEAWSAMEQAGYTRRGLSETGQIGVFVAVMHASYANVAADAGLAYDAHPSFWSIANRVSYTFDLKGPSLAIDTACSSSLTALHLACQSLRLGESAAAFAGGVNLIAHPAHLAALAELKVLSPSGRCRAFGVGADGMVAGEGVGCVLLKPLHLAIRDGDSIHAVIKGSAVNSGGNTNGFTVPNPVAQADVVTRALEDSGVDPSTIGYIEAHGTGTALGDPIEIRGLVRALGGAARPACAVGSVKSNIGHLESAAGISGLIKVILQMKHHCLVPTLHADRLNPGIALDGTLRIQRELAAWDPPSGIVDGQPKALPRRAGVSSFGAGGANAHVIVEESVDHDKPADGFSGDPQLIVLSAGDPDRLLDQAGRLAAALNDFEAEPRDGSASTAPVDVECIRGDIVRALEFVLDVDVGALRGRAGHVDEFAFEDLGCDVVDLNLVAERLRADYKMALGTPSFVDAPTIGALARDIAARLNQSADGPHQRSASPRDLRDVAFTLQVGREGWRSRVAVVAASTADLVEKLRRFAAGDRAIPRPFHNLGEAPAGILAAADREREADPAVRQRDLDAIAKLWVAGKRIEWEHLWRTASGPLDRRRRVPLPTYRFATSAAGMAKA